MKIKKSVEYYTKLSTKISVNFPEMNICCQFCPFCYAEKGINRHWCKLTNEMIYAPECGVGGECPLELEV